MRKMLFLVFLGWISLVSGLEPSIYFTHEVDFSKKFIEQVRKEQESIKIASHRLSDEKVIKALISAYERGVKVEVIVDPSTITKKTPLKLLAEKGVPVFVWQVAEEVKKDQLKHMLHTFCVFGSKLSWTGSYEFPFKGRKTHRGSALVLRDEKVAKAFLDEFQSMQKGGAVPFLSYLSKKKGQ